MLYSLLRPLLYRLDPERAHHGALAAVRLLEAVCTKTRWAPRPWSHPLLAQRLWGVDFANPVGLAAGFDKDACAPHVWPLFGFGFAELGTVTAAPQPGNPRPRLFRLSADAALINRLGFNSAGAAAVAGRLAVLTARLPIVAPLGINLGKSRVTPLAEAAGDYVSGLRRLACFASYLVINVSSPNTPGLRDLQAEAQLAPLLAAVQAANAAHAADTATPPRPVLLKVAPDLPDDALADIVAIARAAGIAGFVATNTTVARPPLRAPIDEVGGLSGAPLRDRATAVIRALRRCAGPDLPIIGVGGIASGADAYAKIRAGASLVQVYTGMIYGGPWLARRIGVDLAALLARDGLTLADAVGRDA